MWLLRVLRVAAILTPVIPARVGYWLCRLIALLFFVTNARVRRQVVDNQRHVQPRTGYLRWHYAAARVCTTVITNYYDLLRLRSVDREALPDLLEVHGREHLDQALQRGSGVIVLSAHMGNFSVVAQYPATLGLRTAVVAERVQPAALFHYMTRLRSAMGMEVLPPGFEATRAALRLLRQNGVLLLAGDRDVVGHGMKVDVFGEPVSLPVGPVLLAMRTGAPLLPAFTIRRGTRRSLVIIREPIQLVRSEDREADLRSNMQRMARALEEIIKTDPGQWAVLQRIWGPPSAYFTARGEGLGGIPRSPEVSEAVQAGQDQISGTKPRPSST